MKRRNFGIGLAALLWISISLCQGQNPPEKQIADLRLPYNRTDLRVDLGVGLWGIPMPMDVDGDGRMDLWVACPDYPYKGIYYFHNIGTQRNPLFDRPVQLSIKADQQLRLSMVEGKPRFLAKGVEYVNFTVDFFKHKQTIPYEGEVLGAGYKNSRSNTWTYVDWEQDGDQDIIVGIDTWDDYGWDNAYNAQGKWMRGPLHGYVYLLENVEGKYVNRGKVMAGDSPVDTYGAPNPCVADFDGDGDLDLICGEFTDGFTWFENTGNRQQPRFAAGRRLKNGQGDICLDLQMIVPVANDFDGDGHMDLIVGDEDGRVAWIRHTGRVEEGMPVFESPVYLQQKAGDLKFGALSTPFAVDWDGDGKQDLIAGNSAGQLAFIRNLTGGEKPSWDSPQLFTVEGQPIRIMAGENGSIQGPAERKWGYTVVTVADWDGDGRLDLIVNSIYGQVEWFRNIGGKDRLALAPARPVRVKWGKKACKPVWNWWEPQENTLVTQWRTTPVAIDWNEDGLMDLVMLDHEGYLAYYERFRDSAGELWLRPGERIFYATSGSVYHPVRGMLDSLAGPLCLNPGKAGRSGRRKICFTDWNGDGRPDLMVDSRNVAWFENKGVREGKVWFEYKGNVSEVQLAGHTTCPTAVYRKGKRLADLVVGAEDGHFYLIENPYNN